MEYTINRIMPGLDLWVGLSEALMVSSTGLATRHGVDYVHYWSSPMTSVGRRYMDFSLLDTVFLLDVDTFNVR